MSQSALLIDMFVRGMAAGAAILLVLAVWRSAIDLQPRIVTLFFGLGAVAWLITESQPLWDAMGTSYLILSFAYPMGGVFWLFVLSVFADRPVTWLTLTPAAVLFVSGVAMGLAPQPWADWIWVGRNLFGGVLILHAGLVVVRDWRDDMVESRRRLRSVVLGASVMFGLLELTIAMQNKVHPVGAWMQLTVGRSGGAALMAVLLLATGVLFLRATPSLFGPARRAQPLWDARLETADRVELERLDAVMAEGAWRREGLTIGSLADDVGVPEHRLRRLINSRLGYRNFADFLNARRIEAAKARLGDPQEARTTVAVIAFDLGYGSLGPFNRAFRAATGASPTEWRRQKLGDGSPELQDAR
jgi:AraC-like DNA-binding protein